MEENSSNLESFSNAATNGIGSLGLILLGTACVFISAYRFLPDFNNALSSMHWVKIPGTVVGYKIDGESTLPKYRYAVQNKVFLSERFCFEGSLSQTIQAREYPIGQAISVYVDPVHPENAVLRPTLIWQQAYMALFGLGVVIMGFGMRQALQNSHLQLATVETSDEQKQRLQRDALRFIKHPSVLLGIALAIASFCLVMTVQYFI